MAAFPLHVFVFKCAPPHVGQGHPVTPTGHPSTLMRLAQLPCVTTWRLVEDAIHCVETKEMEAHSTSCLIPVSHSYDITWQQTQPLRDGFVGVVLLA